jgi:DNA-binding NarL/FixJ family response regulator
MSGSLLYNKDVFALLDNDLGDNDIQKLEALQKTHYRKENDGIKREKEKSLNSYFSDVYSIIQRNQEVKKAVLDGYKQSEIAEFLKVSRTTISKVFKQQREE